LSIRLRILQLSHSTATPEERFAAIVAALCHHPGVTPPSDGSQARRSFGSSGLKVHNKIFAMLSGERLIVKLPRSRVDALIASGAGEPYDPRKNGQIMKQWVTIAPTSQEGWLSLAREAMEFVGTKY
jgi:TfoX/Sxy family transcriptional regulator of competence genes